MGSPRIKVALILGGKWGRGRRPSEVTSPFHFRAQGRGCSGEIPPGCPLHCALWEHCGPVPAPPGAPAEGRRVPAGLELTRGVWCPSVGGCL